MNHRQKRKLDASRQKLMRLRGYHMLPYYQHLQRIFEDWETDLHLFRAFQELALGEFDYLGALEWHQSFVPAAQGADADGKRHPALRPEDLPQPPDEPPQLLERAIEHAADSGPSGLAAAILAQVLIDARAWRDHKAGRDVEPSTGRLLEPHPWGRN